MKYGSIKYNTWRQFKSDFLIDSKFMEKGSELVFRGQSNPEWPIISSFDRMFRKKILDNSLNRDKTHNNMISKFRGLLAERDDAHLYSALSCNEIIALAQHYGLPTKFIDWSESPYIAAYFAYMDFSNSSITEAEEFDSVSVWVFHYQKTIHNCEFWNISRKSNKRIRNQEGLFVEVLGNEPDMRKLSSINADNLIRILLPREDCNIALTDLKLMGITASKIYPELTGLTEFTKYLIKREYFD